MNIFLLFVSLLSTGLLASHIPANYLFEIDNPKHQVNYISDRSQEWFLQYFEEVKAAGYDLNQILRNGHTLLHMAVVADSPNMIYGLIKSGADPSVKNRGNESALSIAKDEGNQELIQCFADLGYTENDTGDQSNQEMDVSSDEEEEDDEDDQETSSSEHSPLQTIPVGERTQTNGLKKVDEDSKEEEEAHDNESVIEYGSFDGDEDEGFSPEIFEQLLDHPCLIPAVTSFAPTYYSIVPLSEGQVVEEGEKFYWL